MATATVQFRMDSDLKSRLEETFHAMGLTLTTGMNLYAKAVVNQQRIPFEITASPSIPKALQKDLRDVREGKNLSKAFDTTDELYKDLGI